MEWTWPLAGTKYTDAVRKRATDGEFGERTTDGQCPCRRVTAAN